MGKLFRGVALVLTVVGIIRFMPDLVRYLKIRDM